jgi:hypothetical protein
MGQSLYAPVNAVGLLTAQTASIGAEQELARLTGRRAGDPIDVGLLRDVLHTPGNAYMGRFLAWVFTAGGIEVCTVVPHSADDVTQLADALSSPEVRDVVHVLVGTTVPAHPSSPSAASGLPAVEASRILAFTLPEFAAALPECDGPGGADAPANRRRANRADFETTVSRLFLQLTNGAALPGFTDEDRARAHVATYYPGFYCAVWQAQRDGKILTGVYARHSHSADRRLVLVGFKVRHPRTDVTESWQCLVDVTEPCLHFLATGLRPAYG